MTGCNEELWRQYARAHLHAPGWPAPIALGRELADAERAFLRALLPQPHFAVITAANPRGVRRDDDENAAAHRRLLETLRARGHAHVRCDGRSPDGSHVEIGCAVAVPQDDARALAAAFDQLAIYWFDGERVTLVAVDGAP